MTVGQSAYFFAAALILALLEIQIEGPSGWAASLPTWRWKPRFLRRPVTGYHVCLLSFILLLLHLPQVYMGFSWAREAELMSIFFLVAVTWDFLWFAHNPHFGVSRFRREHVWWFGTWWLGVPCDYYAGLAVSAAIHVGAGGHFLRWASTLGVFAGLTLLSLVFRRHAAFAKP